MTFSKTRREFRLNKRPSWRGARIYQIELSSFCNLKCDYCPHPHMVRKKGHISEKVLDAALQWIRASGSNRVALHHFGEPLLHPKLKQRLEQVAAAGVEIQLSSNGVLLDKMWSTLLNLEQPINVMLSVHLWKDAPKLYEEALVNFQRKAKGSNIQILRAYNSHEGEINFHNWAEGNKTVWDTTLCPFIRYNACVVLWNGDLVTCCVDHEGISTNGNILSRDITNRISSPWSACRTCDVGRGMAGETWD